MATNYDKFFNAAGVNSFVRTRDYTPTIINQLFPAKKTTDTSARFVKGANGLPVVAHVHAYDTATEIASRDNISLAEIEKVLIKRQIPLREELIVKLNNPRNNAEVEDLKRTIFNDIDNMVKSVLTATNVLASQVLSTGELVVSGNGITGITVDYGVKHKETLASGAEWDGANADILADLARWADAVQADGGERPAYVVTSTQVINKVLRDAKVKKAMFGTNFERAINSGELNSFLADQNLPQLKAFDGQYREQNNDGTYTTKRYIDEKKAILIPNGAVGTSEFGPTAEEYELTGVTGNEIIATQNVIAQIYRTPDPVARWTKAVASNIPTFERGNEVFIADVLA